MDAASATEKIHARLTADLESDRASRPSAVLAGRVGTFFENALILRRRRKGDAETAHDLRSRSSVSHETSTPQKVCREWVGRGS